MLNINFIKKQKLILILIVSFITFIIMSILLVYIIINLYNNYLCSNTTNFKWFNTHNCIKYFNN